MTQIILSIIGAVLSVLTTVVLAFLNSIHSSQEKIVNEIKEMNKDIRDMLVNIGKSDEHFAAITERIKGNEDYTAQLEGRIHALEVK